MDITLKRTGQPDYTFDGLILAAVEAAQSIVDCRQGWDITIYGSDGARAVAQLKWQTVIKRGREHDAVLIGRDVDDLLDKLSHYDGVSHHITKAKYTPKTNPDQVLAFRQRDAFCAEYIPMAWTQAIADLRQQIKSRQAA